MAQPSHYFRPNTLEEALQFVGKPKHIALVGGAFAFAGLDIPYENIVDLQNIEELKGIQQHGETVRIGSGTSLQTVVDSEHLPDELKESITRSITLNHRNGASVLETLLLPLSIPEWITVLCALDAQVEIQLADGERQSLPLATALGNQIGIMTHITLPILSNNEAISMAHVARTPASIPLISTAVYVKATTENKIGTARASLYGASQDHYLLLPLAIGGYPLDAASIEGAVELVSTEVDPIGDYLGSAEYRREMAAVCVKRALMQCFDKINKT